MWWLLKVFFSLCQIDPFCFIWGKLCWPPANGQLLSVSVFLGYNNLLTSTHYSAIVRVQLTVYLVYFVNHCCGDFMSGPTCLCPLFCLVNKSGFLPSSLPFLSSLWNDLTSLVPASDDNGQNSLVSREGKTNTQS